MKNIIEFLAELRTNNNREWFESNRPRYRDVLEKFNGFTERLIGGIASFDPSVAGLTLKDCTYRIYRDVRFSHDKSPYKTHMGAYVCPKGKNSGYSGYYFHVEPKGENFLGGNMLSAGLYMPQPHVLRSVRDEIFDNGKAFLEAAGKAEGFTLSQENKLKRTPAGYPAGSPYDEYLKLRDIYLVKFLPDDFLLQDNLLESTVNEFRKTYDFNLLMNKAVAFACEEMR